MNKCFISGRLGHNPELKTAQNGTEFATFSVAVDRRKKKGEEKESDWFNCTAFGQTAVLISEYFKKGDGIYMEGRMECTKKDDKTYWNYLVEKLEFPITKKSDKADNTSPIPEAIPLPEDMPF